MSKEETIEQMEVRIAERMLANARRKDSSSSSCSRCVELEQELAAVKAILADPVAVHVNVLRGTIAKLSDANVKHVYPHLFENAQ